MWRFRPMAEGEVSVDPVQGEFFASEEIGDLAEILIREAIQNSLDARRDAANVPAEVVISYRNTGFSFADLASDGQPLYGLEPHIKSENSGLYGTKIPRSTEKMDYLTVEDFGTRGLNGDPAYDDCEKPAPPDDRGNFDFFYFWRNIGRSGKKEGLGSWGLGKYVFPASSRINTYFGLTCRTSDQRKLLMGTSILKIHHNKGRKYAPYGYYGQFQNDNFFAQPYDDDQFLKAFQDIFQLRRTIEPGLSIVIPFPRAGLLSHKNLVEAVLRDYFYPVIRGQLQVTISFGQDADIVINAETIQKIAREYLGSDEMIIKTIDLAVWRAGLQEDEVFVLKGRPSSGVVASIADIDIDTVLEAVQERLHLTEKVALRLPVHVKPVRDSATETCFEICYAQTDKAHCIPAKYIRQGIDVKNANRTKLDTGCIALVEVHDTVLGKLLRISEPPAHDRWEQRNNEDLLCQYEKGSKTIGFVKSAPHDLWRLISKKNAEQNVDLLRDIFHLNTSDLQTKGQPKSGAAKPKGQMDEGVEPLTPSIRMVQTGKLDGERSGFFIAPAEGRTHTPETIEVTAAYRVPSGNHFKNYSSYDFKLNKPPINIELIGVEILSCKENSLILKVTDEDFLAEVTGFDKNRDLVVKVIPARSEVDVDQEV